MYKTQEKYYAEKNIFLLIILSVFIIGCRTAPIQNVTNAQINTNSGKKPTLSAVTHDILQAGVSLGWEMKKDKHGHIIATLNLRKHMVKVDINYTQTEYSIIYNDSHEMQYDGSTIHSNYNSWVQNLNKKISGYVYNNQ